MLLGIDWEDDGNPRFERRIYRSPLGEFLDRVARSQGLRRLLSPFQVQVVCCPCIWLWYNGSDSLARTHPSSSDGGTDKTTLWQKGQSFETSMDRTMLHYRIVDGDSPASHRSSTVDKRPRCRLCHRSTRLYDQCQWCYYIYLVHAQGRRHRPGARQTVCSGQGQ